jgi:proteasome activator subunit 4
MYDEQMFQFISKLTVLHLNPEASDPIKISELPDDERSEGEGRPDWYADTASHGTWQGLYKDVGIFTEHEWNLLMCKCLASMGKHHSKVYKGGKD